MLDFASIDFEMANQHATSICRVGAARVDGGVVTDRAHQMVRPTPHFYTKRCTAVHGLEKRDTEHALHFPAVWACLVPFLRNVPSVAHNAVFDFRRLKAPLAHY